MFLRKVVSWPNSMHDAATSMDGSHHGSRHGVRLSRHSASILPLTEFDYSYNPERILHAVYHDEQRVIDAILAAGGKEEVRGAIIWRASGKTIEKLYAKGCCDRDFIPNLYGAAAFGHPDALETLLDHTGLTAHTLTPTGHYMISLLYAAARAGHQETVRRLLARGADPKVGRFMRGVFGRRKYHITPLDAAVRSGRGSVVRQLLEHTPASPRDLRHLLDQAIVADARTCCHVLLEFGAKPNANAQEQMDKMGDPLLRLAMRRAMGG